MEKFESLKEVIDEYYSLVKKNENGLPPYAVFDIYLKDENKGINRPKKIKEIIDFLADESQSNKDKLNKIMELWATGSKINVEEENKNFDDPRIIHSISNTTRLQVCIKNNIDGENGKIINKKNLLIFATAIGKYIKSFKDNGNLKETKTEHNLIENNDFKDVLNNNINAAVNEILFWYYYDEDIYPIINSRAKNSRMILNKVFLDEKTDNDISFNQKCMELIENDNLNISKQLMLDQLFYTIDEIKSMKKVDEEYKNDKNNEIYKFYQRLWNTVKDVKIVSNDDFFNNLLEKSKNIILYGAPGTGKTWTSENNIENIIKSNPNPDIDKIRFKKVQFHPSYSYEDFMEGLKPIIEDKNVVLKLQDGDFMQFCKEAQKFEESFKEAKEKDKMKYAFFFLVDEINRAELSRVFGEVMYALDKRGNKISTQYSYMKKENKEFMIPENIYFIGTMNDVDRSIDSFDIALRRRFFWYRMDCDYNVVFNELEHYFFNIGEFGSGNIPESGYLKACYDLNQFITSKNDNSLGLGKLYELGHDYFLKIRNHTKQSDDKDNIDNKDLKSLFEFSIEPLLIEYLRTEYSEDEIEDKIKKAKEKFVIKTDK